MSVKIRNRVQLSFDAVDEKGNPLPSVRSRTKQAFAEQVNINTIIKKISRTGLVPQKSGAFYGDFSGGEDYQTALDKIQYANDQFMTLPADIRNRFENNPAKLLSFLADPANKAEAIKLGLLEDPANNVIPRVLPPWPAPDGGGNQPAPAGNNSPAPAGNQPAPAGNQPAPAGGGV